MPMRLRTRNPLKSMQVKDIPTDVLVKEPKWNDVLELPEAFCATVISGILKNHKFAKSGELSIALVNDDEIQTLNKAYRNKNAPTNVLSFPDGGPAPILGDIVIALETITGEANEAGKSFTDHVTHMLVHGFLHLQGYDHENDKDAAIMEGLEVEILTKMNIDNPYIIKEPVAP